MSTEIEPLRAGAGTARPRAEPSGTGTVPAPARRGRWVWLFLLGWVLQVAVRLWLASGQTMPVATPDEAGYLFAARVLTGGPDADLSYGTVYRGGYPLLLTPAFWIGDDPVTVYRSALVINALVSALMLPLAYLLLRALHVRRRWSYVFAHVTALLPGVLFYSEFVLTDAVLPVVLLGWLLLVHAWLTAPNTAPPHRVTLYGAGASLLVVFAYTSHTRGAIFLVVHGALLAAAVLCKWRPWRAAASAALVALAGTFAGTLLNHSLLPHLYPAGDNDLSGNLARRLTTQDGMTWTLSLGTGQVWYQAVATGGLAALGLVTVAFAAVRRGTPARLRALALGLLAIVAGIAFATSAALPVEYRIGNYVYGRYLACVTPILVAVGVAVLLRAPRRMLPRAVCSAAVLTVLAACVVQWYAGDRLSRYTYTRYDFPETSFLTWDWTSFRLWHATLAGLTLLGLAVLSTQLRRPSREAGPLVLAGLLAAVALATVVTATDRIARPLVRETTAHTDLRGRADLPHTRSIALDWNVPWTIRLSHYYWAWWSDGSIFDARWTKPPQNVDMVVLSWPKNVPATATWPGGAPDGWKVTDSRRTPEGDWVAWIAPPAASGA
ncbi:hypothetical protein AGRA3207_005646 [Actinomadura graeca]|uniref:4-amino-4-deoxy-L-arabinose transferase n=1 Tax=Actinomadura graeca TaxID=2750812 RepID=A0ABX8R1B2_9ACTN|nr:hypothetical protein [Actinomadura graeca]QXJ24341.1 hypothetical protein AGRA3207_005646 [Actinomadura graeca]